MKMELWLSAALTVILLSACNDDKKEDAANPKGEKCEIVKGDKNLIKEHMADCETAKHSCAGQNAANEKGAWIYVPAGKCKEINEAIAKDDWKSVPEDIEKKLDH